MKILSISADRSIADPTSPAAERQRAYYAGWEARIVILAPGASREIELAPGLRVSIAGGVNKAIALLRGMRLAKRFARSMRPEVVTAQDPLWCGLVASCAARKAKADLHIQDHSGLFAREVFGKSEWILRPFSAWLVRHAARVRTVSARGASGLERVGVPHGRIDIVPIATDVSRFSSVPESKTIGNVLCVARLEREKGVDLLLRAWEKVVTTRSEAKLRIVGDGSQRVALEKLVRELGIADSVEFIGKQADVVPFLEWSTVVVQPSRFEGWGLSVIEAAAAGRPIVMTDVGCAGEVIREGESGRVVPVGDVDAFAKAVLEVLADPHRASMYAWQASEAVRRLPSQAETSTQIRTSFERSIRRPRLLVVTQIMGIDDPVLGFFHAWVKELAARSESVLVICLKRGHCELPLNVRVLSLGKEEKVGRGGYLKRFFSIVWNERQTYDTVFVHMNEVYVFLAGWLWRLMGKHVGLWRNHPEGTWMTPIAAFFANRVFCTSPFSFTMRYRKTMKMPAGIDTELFAPVPDVVREPRSILFFGRVSPVKRVDVFVDALEKLEAQGIREWSARIVGDAPERDAAYAQELRKRVETSTIHDRVRFEPGIPNREAPALFSATDIYVNATPSGSFDKIVIEAMACECLVAVGNRNFEGEIEAGYSFKEGDGEDLARVLKGLLSLSSEESAKRRAALRCYAVERHGLTSLIDGLIRALSD